MTLDLASDAPLVLSDGVHRGLSYAQYHRLDAIGNSSVLKKMRRSPQFYRATKGKDDKLEGEAVLGVAVHAMLLGAESFDEQLVVTTQCVALTAAKKRCSKGGSYVVAGLSYCGTHVDQEAEKDPRAGIDENDVERCRAMVHAIREDADASAVLHAFTGREVTLLWTDAKTGLRCKGRVDVWDAAYGAAIWDVKKTLAAHPDRIGREIVKRDWHAQLAWYCAGARALGFDTTDVGLIVVNDCKGDDVHEVGVYDLDSAAIGLGESKNRAALDEYAECMRTDRWPGFGRRTASVPVWALEEDEDLEATAEGAEPAATEV